MSESLKAAHFEVLRQGEDAARALLGLFAGGGGSRRSTYWKPSWSRRGMAEPATMKPALRRVLWELRDYLPDLILIGGWVPYLYRRYGGLGTWRSGESSGGSRWETWVRSCTSMTAPPTRSSSLPGPEGWWPSSR